MNSKRVFNTVGRAAALAALLALTIAGSAFATGTATYSSGVATFTAGTGDDNSVTYDWTSYGWEIHDVVAITPGTGCVAIDSDSVRCGNSATKLVVNLGDLDDWSNAVDPSAPGIPTVNGGDGNDYINGSDSMEIFNGGGGNDTINAENGKDTINGGDGVDTLNGGGGNDTFDGGYGGDRFSPGAGTDKLTYASRTADLFVEVSGLSGEWGEGDLITQFDGFEEYALGFGNDQFYGVWSNVAVYVTGGNGTDTIHGTSHNDILNGQGGTDIYRGGLGDDKLYGLAGDDIRGDGGYDTAYWGSQASSIVVTVDDVANDGPVSNPVGNVRTDIEKVIGTNFADTITGQAAAPTYIVGSGGSNILTGGSANDSIDGGPGNDTINPGGGLDTVAAGSGLDTVFANDGTTDTVDCGDSSPDDAHADTGLDAVTGCESIWWY